MLPRARRQFGTLATLFPRRIDLGLGRAPGTDQTTVRALRRDPAASDDFPQDGPPDQLPGAGPAGARWRRWGRTGGTGGVGWSCCLRARSEISTPTCAARERTW